VTAGSMEHERIEKERIVDLYLAGRLAAADSAAFEEHLFECPACFAQVEAGAELRRGLQLVATEEASRAVISLGLLSILREKLGRTRPRRLIAAGALGLALLALPLILVRQQLELSQARASLRQAQTERGASAPISDFLVVALGATRALTPAELVIDPEKSLLLSLELPEVTAERYQVTIEDPRGQILWTGENLRPSLYDSLLITLPASFLKPGDYRIMIAGLGNDQLAPFTLALRILPSSNPR
jgi:anti-sigma factor RsiW